jgi:flavin reductase (DIM6/NTAB) family NADH-FMN oxidoreductase RutF
MLSRARFVVARDIIRLVKIKSCIVIGGNMDHSAYSHYGKPKRLEDHNGDRGIDQERYRSVIGRFASGVGVITTRHEGIDYGLTASAVTSVSLDPPMLLICLNKASNTQRAIAASQVFALNILHEQQSEIARRFASARPDKFVGLGVSYGESGVPLLDGMLATIECRVAEVISGGTHSIFLAKVEMAHATEGMPLTYFRGKMGRFASLNAEPETSLRRATQ